MADAYVTPPRDSGIIIKLYHKDLAEVMFQAAQKKEVLSALRDDHLDRILLELNAELNRRGESNVSTETI